MPAEEVAIQVKNVSKTFLLPHERKTSVKSAFINIFSKSTYEKQEALKNISFEVKKGDFFGIVGRNGSGKSTLLKLLAEIYTPTNGSININGTLTPFIELGVGFNPELTGRENVFLNGALLGFSRREMEKLYDDIVKFAELEKFMDQKLKNYSSGMQVRLAFSIAIRAESAILLLDEVLAVGDALFQKKCYNYFKELKRDKKTVILVSHDSSILKEYCSEGILLESGTIQSRGKIASVVNDYVEILNNSENREGPNTNSKKNKKQWGTGGIIVKSAEVIDPSTGNSKVVYTDKDLFLEIKVNYEAKQAQEKPVYGIIITDAAGQSIFASNTIWMDINTLTTRRGSTVTAIWKVPNIFNNGDFNISPAVADKYGSTIYDWREDYIKFKIRKTRQSTGLINTAHKLTINEG